MWALLGMKRGLALAAAHDQPHDLVMVARYDLLFFSVLRFAELPPPAEVQLWLPTWCMRYEFPSGRQRGALSRACGGGQPAYVMTPPLVSVEDVQSAADALNGRPLAAASIPLLSCWHMVILLANVLLLLFGYRTIKSE